MIGMSPTIVSVAQTRFEVVDYSVKEMQGREMYAKIHFDGH